jgi:hypothetical protein
VGVSRLLQIIGSGEYFGFQDGNNPQDYLPFGQAPFFSGVGNTTAYTLSDSAYRTLIAVKAASNIAATTAPALNQILQTLFAGRGNCYVLDTGNMTMQYVFNFPLTTIEYAILTQSGVPPHPAGVAVSVVQV